MDRMVAKNRPDTEKSFKNLCGQKSEFSHTLFNRRRRVDSNELRAVGSTHILTGKGRKQEPTNSVMLAYVGR